MPSILCKKLNLGCGEFKKAGFVNLDYYSVSEPDVRHDLNVFPYPFENNEFDVIEADHILEHLDDVFSVIREIHRISKHNGRVSIRVPHFSRGFTHAEHRRGFDITLPYYFVASFPAGYQGVELKLDNLRLTWFAQPQMKRMVLPSFVFYGCLTAGRIIDFFANLSVSFCSRCWCFLVGGFDEIHYEFLVVKD